MPPEGNRARLHALPEMCAGDEFRAAAAAREAWPEKRRTSSVTNAILSCNHGHVNMLRVQSRARPITER